MGKKLMTKKLLALILSAQMVLSMSGVSTLASTLQGEEETVAAAAEQPGTEEAVTEAPEAEPAVPEAVADAEAPVLDEAAADEAEAEAAEDILEQAAEGQDAEAEAIDPADVESDESDVLSTQTESEAETEALTETETETEAEADFVLVTAVLEDSETPIGDAYTNLRVAVDKDQLDLAKSPIKEDVTRAAQVEGTGRLYVESFDYSYATVDGERVTALKRADIQEDTIVCLHYFNTQTKTKYVYEDSAIKVTATVSDPEAIPDDAKFVVTQLTKEKNQDAIDAYLSALNEQEAQDDFFDQSNTLLYDIAFLAPKADEEGNIVSGDFVEIKPDSNKIDVKFEFKKQQLKETLGVKENADFVLYHLPLVDSKTFDIDSTLDAAYLEPSDVKVENLEDNLRGITLNKETVSFDADGFSVFAFTVDFHLNGVDYSIPGSTQILLSGLIQKLHITADGSEDGKLLDVDQVKEVKFSDEELVSVEAVSGIITYLAEDGIRENINVGELDYLITSKKAFSSDEVMTIVLKDGRTIEVNVTDAQDALDVAINLYDYDDKSLIDIPSNFASDNIFLVVWAGGSSSDISSTTGTTPWAVVDVSAIKGASSPFNFSIEKFNIQTDYADQGLSYSQLVADGYQPIRARLIHTSESIGNISLAALRNKLHNELRYNEIWNGGFEGYEVSSRIPGMYDDVFEVNFKKGNAKEQDVVFEFKDESDMGTIGDGYYVLLKALKYGGNANQEGDYYHYVVPVNVDGTSQKVTIPITGTWEQGQLFSSNWTNLSAIIIKKNAGGNIQIGGNKPDQNSYKEVVALGDYIYEYEGFVSESDDDNHVEHQEFKFILKKANYEPAKTPEEIMGPGIDFGITANEFHQAGHLQSNFATNNYSGQGDYQKNVQPDMSNAPGLIIASKITGKIFYAGPTGAVILTNSNDVGKVGGHTEDYIIEESTEEKIKNKIVDPIINHGANMSANLLNKEATFEATSKDIDLTQFPDGITIYIDGDALADHFAAQVKGQEYNMLNISMLPGQTIVFNFDSTTDLTLGKINYTISGVGDKNTFLAEHVIYNCASVENLTLDDAFGMFLVPSRS